MAIFGKAKNQKKEEERKTVPAQGNFNVLNKPDFLIKQAWITEKAGRLMSDRQYVFIVHKRANKPEVKKAIQSLYRVKVAGVNIVDIKGKSKRLGRSLGRTSDYKKAIVTLKEGEKIEALAV